MNSAIVPDRGRARMLEYTGSKFLRQRLVLSTLTGKPVKFVNIRNDDENPGLLDCEVLFLRFLEALTNGPTIEINYTGTELIYRPGAILGGPIDFDCGTDRCISYFLEPCLILAPFSKLAFKLKLAGLTANEGDTSIDIVRTVYLKIMAKFGIFEGVDLKILKRGASPLGGGEVTFSCPVVTLLQNVDLSDSGRIKRIRGIAATTRVSPQVSNRLVESCRGLLNPFIPDIYINSDVYKGEEAGKSPGFSISLVAESTTGALLYADQVGAAGGTPEDIGQKAARRLLKEVAGGGYVNSGAHYFLLSLMAMTVDHVNKATLSGLSLSDEEYMASIKDFIGVAFKVRQSSASNTCIVSCLGSGYVNFSQRMQ